MKWSRREILKLAAGAAAAGVHAALPSMGHAGAAAKKPATGSAARVPIDYTKAKAVPTICFGCTTHCGVIGWVQDGLVRKIEGNPLDPNTRGAICSKANGMLSYTYYPDRLLYPLERVGKRGEGKWRRISWEDALTKVADKLRPLREAGTPEQFVFHYGRDKTKGFSKRFTNAFGTPHRLNRRSICSSNRRAPLMSFYGRDFEWETQDFENTKYIVNFGANPMEAHQGGLYMLPRIVSARVDGGAHMVSFDVRPSATASSSDEYWPVRPASDGAIALAMAHVILREGLQNDAFWDRWANVSLDEIRKLVKPYTPEFAAKESGVPAKVIERIARDFAKAAPHCTTLSNRGSAKHYNGVQGDRAIRMLDVLVGNVGKKGGFCLSTLRMWTGHYGQEGLPKIKMPGPSPSKPSPWLPGTREFKALPEDVQARVKRMPKSWQKKYFGELATPSEYPLSWLWYSMRVGQLVYPYIAEGRQKVGVYMSYTLGASFGYPEANVARDVLKDESLIPFHVAIDISYSEQAALADIILPDATSLERWDAHSTNAYNLVPYTGIRQPLVKPAGEARSFQDICQALARRIGGGMEDYFAYDDLESFYREWYKEVPIGFDELKRRGIWYDPNRPKDYELYERELTSDELRDTEVDPKTQVIYRTTGGKRKAVGIVVGGKSVRGFPTPTRKIQVRDTVWPLAAEVVPIAKDDINARDLPAYERVPEHRNLSESELILTTFKWNVHTQGRSGYWKYHAEVVHTNPAFVSPSTAKKFGVKTGDEVEITVMRPGGITYRAGEKKPVGSFVNRVRVLEGMSDGVVACSHHVGHWEHGSVGRADAKSGLPDAARPSKKDRAPIAADPDIPSNIWWAKSKGGPGGGVHINDALPINPAPLVGGQNWYDNVCRLKKLS